LEKFSNQFFDKKLILLENTAFEGCWLTMQQQHVDFLLLRKNSFGLKLRPIVQNRYQQVVRQLSKNENQSKKDKYIFINYCNFKILISNYVWKKIILVKKLTARVWHPTPSAATFVVFSSVLTCHCVKVWHIDLKNRLLTLYFFFLKTCCGNIITLLDFYHSLKLINTYFSSELSQSSKPGGVTVLVRNFRALKKNISFIMVTRSITLMRSGDVESNPGPVSVNG